MPGEVSQGPRAGVLLATLRAGQGEPEKGWSSSHCWTPGAQAVPRQLGVGVPTWVLGGQASGVTHTGLLFLSIQPLVPQSLFSLPQGHPRARATHPTVTLPNLTPAPGTGPLDPLRPSDDVHPTPQGTTAKATLGVRGPGEGHTAQEATLERLPEVQLWGPHPLVSLQQVHLLLQGSPMGHGEM